MKKDGFSSPIIIFVILILGILGYLVYNKLFFNNQVFISEISTSSSDTVEDQPSNNLTGIWQANGSMAAGWNDRYHFYTDGVYHFYPNQMAKSDLVEKKGTWQIKNGELILNGEVHSIEFYGTKDGDMYPSISIDDKQFWKFSDDPTTYGGENFFKE